MTTRRVRVGTGWLALREPADAAARSAELASRVVRLLPAAGTVVVHDVGCGTGSMARWLAPRLPGPQHWILTDHDADLLAEAVAGLPAAAAGGAPVTAATHLRDLATLSPAELAGVHLVTASAVLDMLTGAELSGLVTACLRAGCPALLTLSVTGRVALHPADPLDGPLRAAFNAHQRRAVAGGRLLGPDAVAAAAALFGRSGWRPLVRPSPWRLAGAQAGLATEWLRGWVAAACEQRPGLRPAAAAYTRRRLAQAATGELAVTVPHQDLLACPPGAPGGR